ncbi:hypothetical protein J1N35_025396 [Gossypium stocksii]|uniref:Uncharacterized protein n=1 Tax=Gossypium stocksii TaxID=47602 RepID=A0A9D3ZY83_9ROSI|nr:hypothetical protein J1N35_025396 [Gossypium stocksii]
MFCMLPKQPTAIPIILEFYSNLKISRRDQRKRIFVGMWIKQQLKGCIADGSVANYLERLDNIASFNKEVDP